MDTSYYIAFYHLTRGDSGLDSIVVVPKELFDKLLPFKTATGVCENYPQELFEEAYELEDADLRPSERDAIPDDHWLQFELY